jgi:hypothetical protein
VGAFLLRVAIRKAHRNVIWTCIAVNILFNVFYFTFTVVQCFPINGFWLRFGGLKHVKCQSHIAVVSTFAASGVSALIDWIFGLLPILILWDLNMNKRKKIALGMIMGLGAVYVSQSDFTTEMADKMRSASAAPIVRIPYTATLGTSHDFLCKIFLPINLHTSY